MKSLSLLIAALLALAPAGAQAVTVKNFLDPSKESVTMGTILPDYTGDINTKTSGKGGGEHKFDSVSASPLSHDTKIVFTYELSGVTNTTGWLVNGPASSSSLLSEISGWNPVTSPTGSVLSYIATLSLSNLTGGDQSIFSYVLFNGNIPKNADIKTSYVSSPLSPVPLPAALPLFAAGLAGLAGVKRFRKSDSAV